MIENKLFNIISEDLRYKLFREVQKAMKLTDETSEAGKTLDVIYDLLWDAYSCDGIVIEIHKNPTSFTDGRFSYIGIKDIKLIDNKICLIPETRLTPDLFKIGDRKFNNLNIETMTCK